MQKRNGDLFLITEQEALCYHEYHEYQKDFLQHTQSNYNGEALL